MSCDHEGCLCEGEVGVVREGGERFCSDYCADAKGSDDNCECGHAGCSTAELKPESAPSGRI